MIPYGLNEHSKITSAHFQKKIQLRKCIIRPKLHFMSKFLEKRLVLACDHGGLSLKNHLMTYLRARGFDNFDDLGTYSSDSVDYPDFGQKAANAVLEGKGEVWGIVICGSGIGISIAANRNKGIRCALCADPQIAALARQHNNANMLALAGRFLDPAMAEKVVEAFMESEFEGGRHENRIVKLDSLSC